jgi:excisionase family DNA binding protein
MPFTKTSQKLTNRAERHSRVRERNWKGNVEADDHNDVMTVPEVSEYLRLSESTIYKLAQEGKLPGRKIGGTWRFSREGLDSWLRQPSGLEQST